MKKITMMVCMLGLMAAGANAQIFLSGEVNRAGKEYQEALRARQAPAPKAVKKTQKKAVAATDAFSKALQNKAAAGQRQMFVLGALGDWANFCSSYAGQTDAALAAAQKDSAAVAALKKSGKLPPCEAASAVYAGFYQQIWGVGFVPQAPAKTAAAKPAVKAVQPNAAGAKNDILRTKEDYRAARMEAQRWPACQPFK